MKLRMFDLGTDPVPINTDVLVRTRHGRYTVARWSPEIGWYQDAVRVPNAAGKWAIDLDDLREPYHGATHWLPLHTFT